MTKSTDKLSAISDNVHDLIQKDNITLAQEMITMIPFNKPPFLGNELNYIEDAIKNDKICGDGKYTNISNALIEEQTGTKKALITTSCTHALEMTAVLSRIEPGDEVIMPSFTFVSTANAFVLRGAKIVFVDIRRDTMNIDEKLIEQAITEKTRAIVPVHYAGVSCEMDTIMDIARKYNLIVIEDAAQGVGSKYKGKALGAIGDLGTFSYHETKNISCGEGGALLINNEEFIERAHIIREKGTNRNLFFRGAIDKYSWVDVGSSWLPSELNAAYLCYQLENVDNINSNRMSTWNFYYENLKDLANIGKIEIADIPDNCEHNAHMFWVKAKDLQQRTELIAYLKESGIITAFHYVPLHSAEAGKVFGRFGGEDIYTTIESERLLRLPMYYGLPKNDASKVIEKINNFYNGE